MEKHRSTGDLKLICLELLDDISYRIDGIIIIFFRIESFQSRTVCGEKGI